MTKRPAYELDHVVISTIDLASTRAHLEALGLHPLPDRAEQDSDWFAVLLGDEQYLDVGSARLPATTRTAEALAASAGTGAHPALWVVRSPDCRADAERLGLDVREFERDGVVAARTVAIDEGLESGGVLPCFITYLVPKPPAFAEGSGAITRVTVADPEGSLERWLPDPVVGVSIRATHERGIREVAVRTDFATLIFDHNFDLAQ